MPKVKRLFWDIESLPNIGYFWQSGWRINIPPENIIQERQLCCIGYKWEGKKAQCLTWDGKSDKQLVIDFCKIAREADELVAHNGDKFDLKWLNTRCLVHGVELPEAKTIDTLVIARRRFRFNSNKLDYLAKYLLGEGKIHTSFDLWVDVCNGDDKALRKMVDYCKKDVVLLERVWQQIQKFHKPKSHQGVFLKRDNWTCPECGSQDVKTNKTITTTAGSKRFEMLCKDCRRYYRISNAVHNKYNAWYLRGNTPNQDEVING